MGRHELLDIPGLLVGFEEFLSVDLQRAERTVSGHVNMMRRFLEETRLDPRGTSRADLRSYLKRVQAQHPGRYKNQLSAFKVFFRDYLGTPGVVSTFRFPPKRDPLVNVVSRDNLKVFYHTLNQLRARAMLLTYASSGLRAKELRDLRRKHVDPEKRMIIPQNTGSRTKRTYITFYNQEAAGLLHRILPRDPKARIFPVSEHYFRRRTRRAKQKTGVRITPQLLREWFCSEMGRLGVPDRYVDAFCGRVPKSVLAKHYTDYRPEKLQEIYEKADLKVLA